ncbi:MAG: hypothetical protein U1G07_16510 [Verrucomicrobiota bacterium]
MQHRILLYSTAVALCLLAPKAAAGTFSFANLASDEDTGISPTKTYTHLVDFGPDTTPATINGVAFTSKARKGVNYTIDGPAADFADNAQGSFAGTGLGDLFSDFIYGGPGGVQTLTLTGLREAHSYRLTFFVSGWGNPAVEITVSDAPGVVTRMARDGTTSGPDADQQEATGAGSPGAAIQYDYVASTNGTLVVVLDAVSSGDTFHHYGFVNELIGLPDDSDGDGIPNVYEQANGLNPSVNDSALDPDQDGLKNIDEYNAGTKANNADTDGDGLNDGIETNTGTFVSATNTGTSPLRDDTDGDGLKDGVETNTHTFVNTTNTGTNPLQADSDQDGFDDGVEVNGGFDPTVSTSTPESTMSIRTAVEFRFHAGKGISYRIEGSSDLVTWTTVEATINGNGELVTRFYSIEGQPFRFFQAKRN